MKISTVTAMMALLCLAPALANAAGPAMDWDPGYAWQAGGSPTNLPAGGELKMVGIISKFDEPFGDLDADDPTTEYTFYLQGLISQGTVVSGPPATEVYTTLYSGGTMDVYFDTTPDASFDANPPNDNVPSDFIDGTLLLSGNFTGFIVITNNFTAFQVGSMEGDLTWTGGSLIERTTGCAGLFVGGATWRPSVLFPGYLFRHDGKMDLQCPTRTDAVTWGRIKSLYR